MFYKKHKWISHILEGGKSKIKALAAQGLVRAPRPVHRLPDCCLPAGCVLAEGKGQGSLYKAAHPIHGTNDPLKAPSPNVLTLGAMFSTYPCWEDTNLPSVVGSIKYSSLRIYIEID